MNLQSFRQNLGFFVGVAVLCFLLPSSTFAQDGVTVSGRVVNEAGDPVVGISIAIQPYKVMGNRREEGFVPLWERQTDAEGHFSIWPITPMESVRFVLEGEQTEIQILSIEINEITLYPNGHPHPPFNTIQFSLEEGTEIEDAVITVKTDIRPQVRARVVFADGTPVTNAQIRVRMIRTDLDGSGGGSSSGGRQTDTDGYFVENLSVDGETQFYTLGVEHLGLLAKAPPFILHEGQPQVHLLLKLNGNPIPLAERPQAGAPSDSLEAFLNPPSVWIVNPANGHAYKRIYCDNIADAMDQATAENAYLVSINDHAENEWLQGIFEREDFWIGLSDTAKEGQWAWHSGEPVTYTDWGEHEHERDGGNTEMKDYAIMLGFHTGRWMAVAPGDGRANFTKRAVLERADLPVETSSEDD